VSANSPIDRMIGVGWAYHHNNASLFNLLTASKKTAKCKV